uniref:SFRICE_012301 n=1 Tax=Spodoptera frugiperda TaxID=7108 RepID=A0A2H1VTX9_SPOFR
MATSDVLETERSSFLGFTHEIALSTSTVELVEQLTQVIFESEQGDRRVRRYFEHYDTPFVGDRK